VGDCRLQCIEAVVEWQQGMPAEGNDDGLILDGQNGRSGISWSGGEIGDGTAPLPLGDGLLIDAVAPGQGPQARLTMLYRSTDRLCRCGAPVKNLAHSASFHSREKTAPCAGYAAGSGVPKNYVEAYTWFNLAAGGGDNDAAKGRDRLERSMTASQVAEAQRQTANWQRHK